MLENHITVASDGGCSPNPGRGGWAFAMFHGTPREGNELLAPDEKPLSGAGYSPSSTNNIMELTGLIRALQALRDELRAGRVTPCLVKLRLDSQYTLNSFFDWMPGWKRRGWKKADGDAVKNVKEMQALDALKSELTSLGVTFEKVWVRGHSGDYANELVDIMLNDARAAGIKAM
ncbi:ribonuclease HI [Epibacterium sp. DP7N7-1]|nr:ribonuclease HI [Epibacterium sp. DP7N7-1]